MPAIVRIKPDSGVYVNGALITAHDRQATICIVSEDANFLRASECLPEDLPETDLVDIARQIEGIAKGDGYAIDHAVDTVNALVAYNRKLKDPELASIVQYLEDHEDYKAFKAIKAKLGV